MVGSLTWTIGGSKVGFAKVTPGPRTSIIYGVIVLFSPPPSSVCFWLFLFYFVSHPKEFKMEGMYKSHA